MLDVYRRVANRIGTNEALAFSHELSAWHDAMVAHRRAIARLGFSERACATDDECPHARARELWAQAREVLGSHADTLAFLRDSAGHETTA